MSLYAQAWAERAKVANVYERVVLTLMAHRTPNKDGTGAYPSVPSLADFGVCSERQIQRTIRALVERGLLAEGDQALAEHIPHWSRPRVYDVMIPYGWFSADQRREVDEERQRQGRPPMTPEERPDHADPEPSRAPRSDAGRQKSKRPSLRAVRSANA